MPIKCDETKIKNINLNSNDNTQHKSEIIDLPSQ
jgi:hypothetical protein